MSLWLLRAIRERVTLTFHESLRPGTTEQHCGEIERVAEGDLEAWVMDQATAWDIVTLANGSSFVRQAVPTGGARA